MTILIIKEKDYVEAVPHYHQFGRHPEDGSPIIGDIFRVWVTLEDGTRYEHERSYPGLKCVRDDECEFGYYFERTYEESKEAAVKLAEAITRTGQIDMNYWREIDPEYGSEQYIAQGIESIRVLEEKFEDEFEDEQWY